MVAAVKDLFIEQGAVFKFIFHWHRETPEGTSSPVNITGYSTRMQIRKGQKQPILVEANSENGYLTILDPLEGSVQLYLPATETDKLSAKSCVYDIELIESGGDVHRVLKGKITVDPNITQDEDDPAVS